MMDMMMRRGNRDSRGSYDYARGRRGRHGGDRRMGEDMGYPMYRNDYMSYDYARGGQGGGSNSGAGSMGRGGSDGHYPMMPNQGYYPADPMGYSNGYYDMAEQDYARGGRRDYGYYYDYGGDYGERLTKEEIAEWCKKLMKEVEDKDKQFFSKELVAQKANQMKIQMDMFNEEELLVAMLLMYTDYHQVLKPYIGSNMDLYIPLARAFLMDEDSEVKGGERLAVYYDTFCDD